MDYNSDYDLFFVDKLCKMCLPACRSLCFTLKIILSVPFLVYSFSCSCC
uniref:Uncharacterized protein n=1 Tax=Anguilla anguilla TaxID=7936 RepID=A0A0E9U4A3_ANGAN